MLRVVLADDEKKVLLLMCKLIDWESLGFEIVGMASDGMHALEMIRDKQPHLLVTDIRMPGFDGIDLIRQAKQIQPGLHFIVVSGYAQFEYAQNALKYGVEGYLLKPLKDGELELVVRRIQGQEEALESKAAKEQDMPVFRLNPVKNTKNKYVEQAVQLIREHFREDINISTVAGELEISEGYLSRVFKKETDYTFTSYLTRYRMKKAMSLLKDCRVKVYEVAEQVGYSDTAYFSAQFKKLIGISPSEYQDRSR